MSPPPPHHHDLDHHHHHHDLDQHHFSNIPSTPGKINLEKCPSFDRIRSHDSYALAKFAVSVLICSLLVIFIFKASSTTTTTKPTQQIHQTLDTSWGGSAWENRIHNSARIRSPNGISVLVTGAAGFIGTHVTSALKRRGDGVLGLDSFNDYYDTSLKRARQSLLERNGVFIVEGDINDRLLLTKLFDIIPFTHVMHLAAQAGVRYAMQNPESYINSNIAGFVNLLQVCKSVNPQPAIVWASSSSVYGLNTKVPFSEKDRTDQPASLYAATKKAGEEIAHTYNHIYGLSLTALRFFTVYGPWGRPDMAYFFFTKDILSGKPIQIFEKEDGHHHETVARDFTYIDDIVKGCLGALDTAEKSTGSTGGKKRAAAQLRVFNLGNTSPVTVSEMVEILETALKVEAEKVVVTMPGNGDVPYTHANISLAREQLGYKPTTDLKTGLEKFVHWYLAYYKPHQGQRSSQR